MCNNLFHYVSITMLINPTHLMHQRRSVCKLDLESNVAACFQGLKVAFHINVALYNTQMHLPSVSAGMLQTIQMV